VTRLAASTGHPERFIGIHFMNPVPVWSWSRSSVASHRRDDLHPRRGFVDRLGKTSVVAEDFPGFIVNRILLPMINEAIYVLHEGVGTIESIDMAMRLGAHHPMGPLQLAELHRPRHLPVDHAGALMTAWRLQVPALPAAGEVRRGRLAGRKAGRGFLRLPRETRAQPAE